MFDKDDLVAQIEVDGEIYVIEVCKKIVVIVNSILNQFVYRCLLL